ncbi:Tyrosine-protein kinase baz1b [Sparganum proliferum]
MPRRARAKRRKLAASPPSLGAKIVTGDIAGASRHFQTSSFEGPVSQAACSVVWHLPMPLLGNKLHILNATVKKSKKNAEEEQVTNDFVVPETREICSSKEELDRKNVIYDAKVWTCRVTGRLNLTHKEATKSEQASNNILKKAIQPHFRTAILEVVHLKQFLIGEPVLLKVDASKPIHATIIEVDYTIEEPEVIDLCNDNSSPTQSDKENNATVKRSPIPKKNYSYSVKLVSEEPVVVKHVPSRSIQYADHVRMFIRSNAMRYGPASSGPWIVDPSALRRYCSHVKSNQDPIDRKKLRKLSETYEERYFARIMNERSRCSQKIEENGVKRSPQMTKAKNSLVQDGVDKSENVAAGKKKASDALPKKKMKQATLSFCKPIDLTMDETPNKSEPVTPKKPVLPLTAKRLLRALKDNVEGAALTLHLSRCAKLLTDEQIACLPEDAKKRVLERRSLIEHKNMLSKMTPEEREAYLRDLRQKKREEERRLVDETVAAAQPLPEPCPYPVPPSLSDLQFVRVLSLTEFIYSYQCLLTEGAQSASDSVQTSRMKQLISDLCSGNTDSDEEFNTDDEEEATLTSIDASLPRASIKGLRRLSLDKVLSAVSARQMSATGYRCLTRPMSALLRIILRDRTLSNLKELGIKVSKLPVTPYTAPEFLRLLLVREVSHGFTSARDRAMAFLRSAGLHAVDESEVDSKVPTPGTLSLVNQLTSFDVFALDPEHKILLLELLVERLLDVDSIDDYMHSTDRKATNAYNKRIAAERKRRKLLPNLQTKKEVGGEDTGAETNSDADVDDLASVVKRRRQLAAQAASEREHKEALERERRELEAQLLAENKAAARATQEYYAAALEARIARRITPLGVDRENRRYWHFFCAPHMLFLEAGCADVANAQHLQAPSAVSDVPPDPVVHMNDTSTPPPTPRRNSSQLAALELANLLGSASNSHWFVFDQAEQLNHLQDSLMDRGYREGPLKKELSQNGVLNTVKELLEGINSMQKCKPTQEELSPKSGKGSAVDLVTAKCRGDARAILANVLLKNVYETEIHLRDGGLGGVPDFPAWVSAVLAVQSRYGLVFSLTGETTAPTPDELGSNVHGSDLQALSEILVEVGDNVLRRYLNVPKLKENKKPRMKGEIGDGDGGNATTPWGLSCKSDAIEEEEESSNNNEDEEEDSTEDLTEFDRLKAREADVEVWVNTWRDQVRAASTISRLNLLHACLDACIVWEKSVENARCRICRRKKDDEKLLLCDGCNQGFHLYCLRPPLKSIPRGDWFCISCKPPSHSSAQSRREQRETEKLRADRNRNASSDTSENGTDNSEEEGEETSSTSSEEESSYSDEEATPERWVTRQAKKGTGGLSGASLHKTLPRSASASNMLSNDTTCLVCNRDFGDLISCSSCPNSFHLQCHSPTVRPAQTRTLWLCSVCRFSGSKAGSSAIAQALRPRGTSRSSRRLSYLRLHRMSGGDTIKRPHSGSDNESSATTEANGSIASGDDDDDQDSDASGPGRCLRRSSRYSSPSTREPPTKRMRSSNAASSPPAVVLTEPTCAEIIAAVCRNRHSWPFREAVDPAEVPDYYDIIVDPIDLSMIRKRLSEGRYDGPKSHALLAADLGKMFYNAELYNSADSEVWVAGSQLENLVQSLFRKCSPPNLYTRDKLN